MIETNRPSTAVHSPGDIGLAEEVVGRLTRLRIALAASDLQPGPGVNEAFSELVELCCSPPPGITHDVLAAVDDQAVEFRELCARGEDNLERHWARRILAAADPRAEADRFPYRDNYRDLVRMEVAALHAIGAPTPQRVVVIGAGPLPLTGISLIEAYAARITHVDRDYSALHAGAEVTTALTSIPLPDMPSTATSSTDTPPRSYTSDRAVLADVARDAMTGPLRDALAAADTVVVGALVGVTAHDKRGVLDHIAGAVRSDAHVLVRSATDLRTLLYPPVTAEALDGVEVLAEVRPYTAVVNSVLVARPRTARRR